MSCLHDIPHTLEVIDMINVDIRQDQVADYEIYSFNVKPEI